MEFTNVLCWWSGAGLASKTHLWSVQFMNSRLFTRVGGRIYFERFIDDKQSGSKTDSRDGIYFIPAASDDEQPIIVGQSHHYETTAFSGFLNEKIEFEKFTKYWN